MTPSEEMPVRSTSERDQTGEYVLGHSREELDRLISQSRYIGELSDHFLHLAGLQPGMRVLDVGCCAGDVTLLAARIVGPSGRVTGIDRSAHSIALATARVSTAGLANVSFVTADAAGFAPKEPVDALVGRVVMMYWPDPASVLRHLLESVRVRGLSLFRTTTSKARSRSRGVPSSKRRSTGCA
jgi:2-polyprenyl-3-methyl-5-hydroxy-6-metoxy-1,4-benzoquinol methylase